MHINITGALRKSITTNIFVCAGIGLLEMKVPLKYLGTEVKEGVSLYKDRRSLNLFAQSHIFFFYPLFFSSFFKNGVRFLHTIE